MAQIYFELIKQGERTINDVPARVRDEVVKLLEANGYGELAHPVD